MIFRRLWRKGPERAAGGPVHFIHIRKAGGTAVKDALQPVAKRYGLILHPHRTRLADIPDDHRFFFFIRHPLTRFVSGFYSRLRQGKPHYSYPWSPAEAKAFARFQEANDLAEAISSEHPERAAEARAAMLGISHVNSTFRSWFSSPSELDDRASSLVMVGLQEHLAADFERLKALLGLPAEVALPQDDARAHRNPSGINRGLSPLAERNLREWYADDIRFYERCVELRARRQG